MWWRIYEELNLYNGAVTYLSDDDEDMIEIRYRDGMMIDVGKAAVDHCYYITVVSSDTMEGWKKPLATVAVFDKKNLYDKLQETIWRFRGHGASV